MAFLPLFAKDLKERGWQEVDFVCVTGDAYVDHPSFGTAIISRLLESQGYRVAILAQPDSHSTKDFMRFGRPRLGFLVASGAIDSMVANYTAAKKKRTDDPYSPYNKAGKRPDRAVVVYCKKIREAYGDVPIVIGGLEASLRRFAHYDYWDNKVLPSILLDSGADLLSYGMGEHQTVAIAKALEEGQDIASICEIPGTCYLCQPTEIPKDAVSCASFEKVAADHETYAKACKTQMDEQDYVTGKAVIQKHGERMLVQNPPSPALTQQELDQVFALPFERAYHPSYEPMGGIKAIDEVEFSIMQNRGCFGHCNFCSIAFHQGRHVTCRSHESIVNEAKSFLAKPNFKGYIHDVGGPTANFRVPSCKKQEKHGLCPNRKCLAPSPCPSLQVDHSDYLSLLRELRSLKGIKKVFIRSGLRFDYIMADPDESFFEELVEHHVSGQLKVAPEHCSPTVLDAMGKPHIGAYQSFSERFYKLTEQAGKKQYLVPYLMSSHPGSTMKDAVQLALFLKRNNIRPEQVQDFYPTPGTPSTCMFYTGINPYTMQKVYVPRAGEEKMLQRVLLQYFKPENKKLVIQALIKAGRTDLIGNTKDCLVKPDEAYLRAQKYLNATPEKGGKKPAKGRQASAGRRGSGRNASQSPKPTGSSTRKNDRAKGRKGRP